MTETQLVSMLRQSATLNDIMAARERRILWQPFLGCALTLSLTWVTPIAFIAAAGWVLCIHMHLRVIRMYERFGDEDRQRLRKLYGIR